MSNARVVCLALIACVCAGLGPEPVRADIPGPYPWSKYKRSDPRDFRPATVPPTEQPGTATPPQQPPQKSVPFRSCGNGIGTGFAGIGLAWAALWTGHRFTGRVRRK
jgi:hypothetical protein